MDSIDMIVMEPHPPRKWPILDRCYIMTPINTSLDILITVNSQDALQDVWQLHTCSKLTATSILVQTWHVRTYDTCSRIRSYMWLTSWMGLTLMCPLFVVPPSVTLCQLMSLTMPADNIWQGSSWLQLCWLLLASSWHSAKLPIFALYTTYMMMFCLWLSASTDSLVLFWNCEERTVLSVSSVHLGSRVWSDLCFCEVFFVGACKVIILCLPGVYSGRFFHGFTY